MIIPTAELDKEKASWTTELETLKQQLAARSAVCGFLKAGSQEGRYGDYFTGLLKNKT